MALSVSRNNHLVEQADVYTDTTVSVLVQDDSYLGPHPSVGEQDNNENYSKVRNTFSQVECLYRA